MTCLSLHRTIRGRYLLRNINFLTGFGGRIDAGEHLLHHDAVLDGALVLPPVANHVHEVLEFVLPHVPLRVVGGRRVDHVALPVRVGLARAPDDAALLAHDLDVEHILFNVVAEA